MCCISGHVNEESVYLWLCFSLLVEQLAISWNILLAVQDCQRACCTRLGMAWGSMGSLCVQNQATRPPVPWRAPSVSFHGMRTKSLQSLMSERSSQRTSSVAASWPFL